MGMESRKGDQRMQFLGPNIVPNNCVGFKVLEP
jgi:hypothetical protein